MSFVAAAAAVVTIGATVGSSIMGGLSAQTPAEKKRQDELAKQMNQQRMALLGDEKNLALDATQSEFESGQRNIGMSANMELRRNQAFGDQAYSQSNLATSGTIEQKITTQTGDLLAKAKSDMTKLVETRDLSKSQADLSFRKGEMSAEDAYQSTLTDIASQPTGFLEGMFS